MTRLMVWDIPVRLFHWSLVALVGLSFYTMKTEGRPSSFPSRFMLGRAICWWGFCCFVGSGACWAVPMRDLQVFYTRRAA